MEQPRALSGTRMPIAPHSNPQRHYIERNLHPKTLITHLFLREVANRSPLQERLQRIPITTGPLRLLKVDQENRIKTCKTWTTDCQTSTQSIIRLSKTICSLKSTTFTWRTETKFTQPWIKTTSRRLSNWKSLTARSERLRRTGRLLWTQTCRWCTKTPRSGNTTLSSKTKFTKIWGILILNKTDIWTLTTNIEWISDELDIIN